MKWENGLEVVVEQLESRCVRRGDTNVLDLLRQKAGEFRVTTHEQLEPLITPNDCGVHAIPAGYLLGLQPDQLRERGHLAADQEADPVHDLCFRCRRQFRGAPGDGFGSLPLTSPF